MAPVSFAAPITVTVAGTGTGTVTSSPGGIACTGLAVTCTGWFAEAATVTLTATPAFGHVFAGWAGACTGTGACELYLNGAKAVTATFNAPAEVTYFHVDVVGSVRAVTDAAGDPVVRYDYFPFGESTGSLDGDPLRFTGKERDAETALDDFGARYYRPVWGRFLSVDPIADLQQGIAQPQSGNRYAYCENNPLRCPDPTGESTWSVLCRLATTAVKRGRFTVAFAGLLEDVKTLPGCRQSSSSAAARKRAIPSTRRTPCRWPYRTPGRRRVC